MAHFLFPSTGTAVVISYLVVSTVVYIVGVAIFIAYIDYTDKKSFIYDDSWLHNEQDITFNERK